MSYDNSFDLQGLADGLGVGGVAEVGGPQDGADRHVEHLVLQGHHRKIDRGCRHPELPACKFVARFWM